MGVGAPCLGRGTRMFRRVQRGCAQQVCQSPGVLGGRRVKDSALPAVCATAGLESTLC